MDRDTLLTLLIGALAGASAAMVSQYTSQRSVSAVGAGIGAGVGAGLGYLALQGVKLIPDTMGISAQAAPAIETSRSAQAQPMVLEDRQEDVIIAA